LNSSLRRCLLDPVPEIAYAARLLDSAVTAHLSGEADEARTLLRQADIPTIRNWTESLWGPGGPWSKPITGITAPPTLPKHQRVSARMPNAAERRALHERDGLHCRFCGIPLVRKEVRARICRIYSESAPWGRTNASQHAALQAMMLQYDHLLPHARGGTNDLVNVVITCAPCNYGRWNRTLDEVGLDNPLEHAPVQSAWDGLERFR
jgi:5-methylcytosine-specific restriction endonuclease McrA